MRLLPWADYGESRPLVRKHFPEVRKTVDRLALVAWVATDVDCPKMFRHYQIETPLFGSCMATGLLVLGVLLQVRVEHEPLCGVM